MIDPKEIINYLGIGTGGSFLFWLAWKIVFRNGTDQSALSVISGNFELMAKNLREQLAEQSARIDDLDLELKSVREENRKLRNENSDLRDENRRLRYEV